MNQSLQKQYFQAQTVRPTQMIASFLLKTYEILHRKQYEHIICWDSDNVGFVIKNVLQFCRQILPKYFRHRNFSSFVRQLNMYDFHKVKQTSQYMVFKNCYFKKDGQQLILNIVTYQNKQKGRRQSKVTYKEKCGWKTVIKERRNKKLKNK